MTWGEEWGDEPKRRRATSSTQAERNEAEREEQRQREKNEHYWSSPREVGFVRHAPRGPSLPRGQALIENSADRAVRELGPAVELLLCGPCRSGHHENCLRMFRLEGDGEVACECSADQHWIHQGGR